MKVLFGEYLTWDTPYRVGSHYYARHFLERGWEVGWLGGEFHALNLLQNRAEWGRKYPLWRSGGTQHSDGPWEYAPFKLLPYRDWGPLRSPALAWHGDRLTVPGVRRALRKGGFDRADLLWLSNPQAYPWLAETGGYSRVVYRAADNHALTQGIPASVADIEARIARGADAALVVHADSLDRFRQSAGERTHHMPNGVDLSRFREIPPRPPEYAGITGPIAVYVGSLNYRFDTELVRAVTASRPEVAFVIIGEPAIDLSALDLPNVHLLGPRAPEAVPAYMHHAAAGLLPFRRIPATYNLISIKTYEYAASGLPIVHANMTEEAARDLPVLVAQDAHSFCTELDLALAWGEPERQAARAFAQTNSWDDRFRRLDAIMEGWW